MERIPTMLTAKQQPMIGAVLTAGVSTDGTGLRRIVGIHLDRHTISLQGFVGNHGVQLAKGPLGEGGVGSPLLLAGAFARASCRSVSNVGQVFQSDQATRMLRDDARGNDMIGVGFQPSLSSADGYQPSCRGTSAFALQALSQSCVMIGLLSDTFATVEGGRSLRRGRDGKIAHADIYPDNAGMSVWGGLGSFLSKETSR